MVFWSKSIPNSKLRINVFEMKKGDMNLDLESPYKPRPYYAMLVELGESKFHVADLSKDGELMYKKPYGTAVGNAYVNHFTKSKEFLSAKDELWEFVKAQQIVAV